MSTKRRQLINVTAFVDWNTQIFAAKPPRSCSAEEVARRTLLFVAKSVGRLLHECSDSDLFQVYLRIYHGWHRGFEVTSRRKALIRTVSSADFTALSERANVIIRREVDFGDRLISASDHRLHSKLNCHLPNTLRRSLTAVDEDEEKMVDTAIASDIVDTAHREPRRWIIVMAKDDDLVPPVFTAEAVLDGHEGRVLLLRDRPDTPFLKLDGLRHRL